MPSRDVDIINRLGLHARAAAKFVNTAGEYAADLEVERDGQRVNGKSIMGVMMLAAGQGSTLTLHAEGDDADALLDGLEALIADRFGEGE
ncbi:phosphocarrier protein [Thiohalospira halophila DSM 15071]|jgi:phosphocarrier protein|uniref:Phosphocarrier protein n=1 Tax=Thiohalospira halophila DSM 15071 TaxID=1123397 RepID=A0A1I1QV33_9GAMM|nr:HPr family phosphocarrier protein [Thiohalospira halophila]SFD26004.1 phosphocarrier protein [Thiohalospira halophila DSM 15071]